MKKLLSGVLLLAMLLTAMTSLIVVSADSTATLQTDKITYTEGEPIIVTAKSANSSGKDWVGIMVKGDTTGVAIYWDYIGAFSSGLDISKSGHKGNSKSEYFDLPAGEYTVILIPNDLTIKSGYDQALAKVDITVVADTSKEETTAKEPEIDIPTGDTYIVTDKTTYTVGDPIFVSASSVNASGKDWVGIWPKGYIGQSIHWEYLNVIGKGQPFDIKTANNSGAQMSQYYDIPIGEYTLYLIPNDLTGKEGIPVALASVDIKVVGDPNRTAKAPVSATYKLKNDTDGFADGTLTITLPEDHGADDIYMWWGNDSGKLSGYTRLARFKVTGTTVVHEMTANTLIPQGATKLLIYTYNDTNGVSKECLEVKLPEGAASKDLGKVLSEFQIVSDLHIRGNSNDEYSKHFVGMLQDIVKNSPSSVGIFTVGDIVDRGDKPEYWTYFNELYKSVSGAPSMYLGIGNHEFIGTNYDSGLKQFLENVKLPDGTQPDKVYYDCWVNGYHYIFIGTSTTGTSATLDKEQLKWLEETLTENRDGKPIFLFMHQPMLNTVSGSSTSEGWSGVTNHQDLKAILNKFPEVLMFDGHTHWILDSDNCMYDGEGKTASIFNTSSVAYLWHSYDVPTGERMTGSEGYYIRVYEDKVAVLGRNFVTGEWISSAQFVVKTKTGSSDTTETTASSDEVTTEAPTSSDAATTENAPSDTVTEPSDEGGCGATVGSAFSMLAIIAVGTALIRKRKE